MNRLTPEIVAAAFEQIGAVPTQMAFGPGPMWSVEQPLDCCCGLYAVAAARGLDCRRDLAQTQYGYLGRNAGVPESYAKGFAYGWDCTHIHSPQDVGFSTYDLGYSDGRAAWQAVGEGREARRA